MTTTMEKAQELSNKLRTAFSDGGEDAEIDVIETALQEARREALNEAFLAANHMQALFLQEDAIDLPNMPDRKEEVKWLLRMANEMTGAISDLMEKE